MDIFLFILYIGLIYVASFRIFYTVTRGKKCSLFQKVLIGGFLLPGAVMGSIYFVCIFFGLLYNSFFEIRILKLTHQASVINWFLLLGSVATGVFIVFVLSNTYLQSYKKIPGFIVVNAIYDVLAIGLALTRFAFYDTTPEGIMRWNWVAMVIACLIFVLELYFVFTAREKRLQEEKVNFLRESVIDRYKNYQQLEQTIEITNEWKRNVSDKMMLLKEIDNPELKPIIEYCEDVINNATDTRAVRYTGLFILDRVLHNYANTLNAKNIECEIVSDDLSECAIPEYMLVSLLAQLWYLIVSDEVNECPLNIRSSNDMILIHLRIDKKKQKHLRMRLEKDAIIQSILVKQDGELEIRQHKQEKFIEVIISLQCHPISKDQWNIGLKEPRRYEGNT